MSRCGIPRKLSEPFKKVYLDWHFKLENYGLTTEIIKASANLSIDQLLICLCEDSNKWMPTHHCELDWIALIELSKRELSQSDIKRAKNAWKGRRNIIKDSKYKVVRSIKDKKRLDILLEKIS